MYNNNALKSNLITEFEDLIRNAAEGREIEDDIIDELGDYFDDVDICENVGIQKAYASVRDTIGEEIEEQVEAAKQAIIMLNNLK